MYGDSLTWRKMARYVLMPPLKMLSRTTTSRITQMLREYMVPTMIRIGSTGKIRLTSVIRWIKRVDPAAAPDARWPR